MPNEKLIQLQFALFFNKIENRPDKLISKVDSVFDGIFDQIPNTNPLPNDAPPEIPRVTMHSSNGQYVCNISNNRIDFIEHLVNSNSSISANIESFIEKVYSFSETIINDREIIRFGLVGNYFIENNNALNQIISKYVKSNIGEVEELNIRYNKSFEANQFLMNDIVEIGKGTISILGGPLKEGIFIQRDLNNKPLEVLSMENIRLTIEQNKSKFMLSGIRELID